MPGASTSVVLEIKGLFVSTDGGVPSVSIEYRMTVWHTRRKIPYRSCLSRMPKDSCFIRSQARYLRPPAGWLDVFLTTTKHLQAPIQRFICRIWCRWPAAHLEGRQDIVDGIWGLQGDGEECLSRDERPAFELLTHADK